MTVGTCEGLAGRGGWYTERWGLEESGGTGWEPGTLSLEAYKGDRYVAHLVVSSMIFSLLPLVAEYPHQVPLCLP